jgi:hypothetical protein
MALFWKRFLGRFPFNDYVPSSPREGGDCGRGAGVRVGVENSRKGGKIFGNITAKFPYI